ncbi:MAG: AMP-dependent synthetase and ligase [Frankiales bacterium]|nr:AMP-dependent synthetase and ligase [Frankiales bacterium]
MTSVKDDLIASATARPSHLAVADRGQRLTYGALLRRASCLARRLGECGVKRGDRVAIVMHSGVECAVTIYATTIAGACFVVLDATTPQDQLVALLTTTRAKAVVCDAAAGPRVRAAAQGVTPVPVVVTGLPPGSAAPGDQQVWQRYGPALISTDLAAIVFTSGSTGVPRGATFLHRNLTFVTSSVLGYLPLTAEDRILSVLPLSHTYGLYQLLLSVRLGATLHLRPGAGPVGGILRDLEDEAITVLPGVPALWQLFRSTEVAFPAVRLLSNAGAALPADRIPDLQRIFPHASLYAMYGQTECARVAFLPPELLASHPDSVGVAVPGTQAWLEDEHGREPAFGGTGELVVRGEHVMQGYWDDEEATRRKLVPGRWPGDRVLRTGDIFRRDADGYLCFVARHDDVINIGGQKVAPLEVERVLCAAPGVVEAVVVGTADGSRGQVIVAHVVAAPGAVLDARALKRHCAERLEASKVPREVVQHQALPRLSSGKVDRKRLVLS